MEIKACLFVSLIAIFFLTVSVKTNAQEKPEMLYKISVTDKRGNFKYGFIDKTGKVIVEPVYEDAGDFHDGLAYVKREDKLYGFVDTNGRFVVEPKFTYARSFSDGLAVVYFLDDARKDVMRAYINTSGKVVIKLSGDFSYEPQPFSEGFANFHNGSKWGYIDKSGKVAIEPKYEVAFPFSEGLAKVRVGEKYGFIDKTGKMVIEPQFPRNSTVNIIGKSFPSDYDSPFRNGLALVRKTDVTSFTGFIDKTGKAVIDLRVSKLDALFFAFNEGLVRVRDGNFDNAYLDTNGKVVIKSDWRFTEDFSEGLAAVNSRRGCENSNCWGYIDKTGNYLIKPQFSSVKPFRGGLAWVWVTIPQLNYSDSYKMGYIDKTGKFVWFTIKK